MNSRFIFPALFTFLFIGCNRNAEQFDASGTFEADEVIVSSELNGKLVSFKLEEGDSISSGSIVGKIDAVNLALQKEQVEASIKALSEKTADVSPQVRMLQEQYSVQESQLANLLHERTRIENLLKQDAATGKQLDDINAQIDVVRKQMAVAQQQIDVQISNIAAQNRSVLSEGKPL